MPKLYLTPKLREVREAKSWTRKEFAQLLTVQLGRSISTSQVNEWENGRRAVQPSDAMLLAKLYKIQFKELVEQK